MSVLNSTCPTCKGPFQSADDLYGTSCGHLYHMGCLHDWQRRGTSCPGCFHYNPSTFKIYLNFDESENKRAETEELTLANEKITQLLVDVSEYQTNFLQLQKQLTESEQHKKEVENRIRQIKDSEENFLNLQGQFTECSEHVKCLQRRINQMDIEYECQLKELQLKRTEIDVLEKRFEAGESGLSDDILKEKIKFLEHRLKNLSEQFEKEIAASTKLSVENLKMKAFVEHLSSREKIVEESPNENHRKSSTKRRTKKASQKENDDKEHTENPPQKRGNDEKPCNTESHVDTKMQNKSANPTDDSNSNVIVIRGLLLHQIEHPLENVVVSIASKMNLSISKDDLVRVNYAESYGQQTGLKPEFRLSVQFKTRHLKDQFLAKKSSLKGNPTTKNISITEYLTGDVYILFKYARDNLKSCGYNCVFTKGSAIFAKTNRSDHNVVCIKNMAQVDSMKKMHKETEKEDKPNVDENLYQL